MLRLHTYIGCSVRHDMDLSGLGHMFEELSISLNAQRRNILPHESLGGRSPFSIPFPTKTPPLHLLKPFGCHATILKPDAAAFSKRRNRGVSLATILELLCLAANLAISSGYRLKNVSQQQYTPFSTKKFPGSPFFTTNPRSFCFIAINSQRIVR